MNEIPVAFRCGDDALIGMVHLPEASAAQGLLIVVGGPQYRVGSHRQFLLLARQLCGQGLPVMRFDYRGMGDSEGQHRHFMAIGPDIAAAIDEFFRQVPGMRSVALWGLCDAASAIMHYAHRDRRVDALVLLNPWVRAEATMARTHLRHYYRKQLLDAGWWRSLLRGEVRVGAAALSLLQTIRTTLRRGDAGQATATGSEDVPDTGNFVQRMREGLEAFTGPVMLVLSGDDLTAAEFREVAGGRDWRRVLQSPQVEIRELAPANHTFARREWRDTIADWTGQWLQKQ